MNSQKRLSHAIFFGAPEGTRTPDLLIRKQQVKEKKLSAAQFISWMIGQEAVIEGICGENKGVR